MTVETKTSRIDSSIDSILDSIDSILKSFVFDPGESFFVARWGKNVTTAGPPTGPSSFRFVSSDVIAAIKLRRTTTKH